MEKLKQKSVATIVTKKYLLLQNYLPFNKTHSQQILSFKTFSLKKNLSVPRAVRLFLLISYARPFAPANASAKVCATEPAVVTGLDAPNWPKTLA